MPKHQRPNPAFMARIWRNRIRQRALDFRRSLAQTRESERRFREAIHFLPIPIGIADRQGRVLAHNQMFTEVFGYTLEEIPALADWAKLAYPDETHRQQAMQTWQADVELALERGAPTPPQIYQITCEDGSRRLVEITTQPVGDLIATVFNDVTARKQAEESQHLFKSLVENSSDAIGMSTPEGKPYYQNEAFIRLFGEIGEDPPDKIYVDKEVGRQVFSTLMAGGQWVGEAKMHASDKSVRDILLRAYPSVDAEGKIVGLVGIYTDVTERRRMEDALRENEAIFSSFLEHSPVYVFFKDKNTRSLRLSKNYEQMLGMPIAEALGKSMDELFPSELSRSMVADDLRILNEGQRVHVVEELNGRVYETTKFPIFKDGKPEMLAGFTIDITDRVRAEQALRESEARYRALFERANDAIFVEDHEDRIVAVNRRACELLGYTRAELLQMRISDLVAPERGRRRRAAEGEIIAHGGRPFESLDVRKDGTRIPVEVTNAALPNGLSLSIVRDITARKRAEEELRRSLEWNRAILAAQPDLLFVIDSNLVFLESIANDPSRLLQPPEQVISRPVRQVLPPFLAELTAQKVRATLQTGQMQVFDYSLASGGEEVFFESRMTLLNQNSVLVLVRDVTEARRAEQALRESEQRFRVLFENAGVGVAQGNTITGHFIKVNQKFCDIVGYTRQEMEGLAFPSITYPDDLQRNLGLLEQLKRGEISEFILEKRYIRKDGSLVWVLLTVSPLWNPGEMPREHITVAFDISEQKRAAEALKESAERAQLQRNALAQLTLNESIAQSDILEALKEITRMVSGVLRAARASVWLLSEDNTALQCVVLCEAGQPPRDSTDILRADEFPRYFEALLRESILSASDAHNDPRTREFARDYLPRFDIGAMLDVSIQMEGRLVGMICVEHVGGARAWHPDESSFLSAIANFTAQLFAQVERKQAEQALRQSEERILQLNADLERRVAERTLQLEIANKELEAFAYSVSHDLRAPLRAIDGFTRILMNEHAGELSAEARELLDKARAANDSMSQLVDALLGLSRTSRAEIRREPIDLSPLAREIMENLSREQPARKVEWLVTGPAIANGDSRLLRVALENLLSNAWKFTSKREQARIEFGAETRNGETIYFARDNGAGFNPRYADKLFGAFQRLHRSDEFEGMGIGLATVQRIIHRHGGRIWAESEPGKGATFYFTLGEVRAG